MAPSYSHAPRYSSMPCCSILGGSLGGSFGGLPGGSIVPVVWLLGCCALFGEPVPRGLRVLTQSAWRHARPGVLSDNADRLVTTLFESKRPSRSSPIAPRCKKLGREAEGLQMAGRKGSATPPKAVWSRAMRVLGDALSRCWMVARGGQVFGGPRCVPSSAKRGGFRRLPGRGRCRGEASPKACSLIRAFHSGQQRLAKPGSETGRSRCR